MLSAEDLRFEYEPGRAVLRGVSARLEPGRVSVVLGPNAAGKTTLLRLLLGLLSPTSGVVKLDGDPVDALPETERARRIAYVPQRGSVHFAFSVRQVVAMGAHTRRDAATGLDEAMHEAEVGHLAERVFAELSAGQQQRVLLARAAFQLRGTGPNPIWLLDEPTSQMDLKHAYSAMERLRGCAQAGAAVLIVLHDLNLAARYADEVWLMDEGRLVAAGSGIEVMTPERLEPVYDVGLRVADWPGPTPLFAVEPRR